MSSPLAAVCLMSALLLGQGEKAAKAPTTEQINKAIAELGDDRFTVREKATQFLWKAGRPAEAPLREALKSDDAEVVSRARFVLEKFKFGIYPDTPAEVVKVVNEFRRGNQSVKRSALNKLKELGRIRILWRLIEAEPNQTMRDGWLREFATQTSTIVPPLLAEGNFEEAGKWLELGAATGSSGARNLAAFLLQQGKLDARIAQLQSELPEGMKNERLAQQLIYLLRAKGDLPAAIKLAEKSGQENLKETLLIEHGDWKEVAKRFAAKTPPKPGLERLGYLAAYHRLAGNAELFEDTIAAIKKYAQDNPSDGWYSFEALAVNGRFADGLEMLEKQNTQSAFKFLARQARYREAFKLAGIEKPRAGIGDWFKDVKPAEKKPDVKPPKEGAKEPDGPPPPTFSDRFHLGLEVARALYDLGEEQTAGDLFAQLGKAGAAHQPELLFALADVERRVGMTDAAFEHGLAAFAKSPTEGGVRRMFPDHANAAVAWWRLLQGTPPKELVGRVRELLAPGDKQKSLKEMTRTLAAAEMEIQAIAAKMGNAGLDQIIGWRHALGETALVHGHKELAEEYFGKLIEYAEKAPAAATAFPTSTSLRLAKLQADRKQWAKAAAWYRRAWEHNNKRHAAALYLMGHALEKAGQAEEGRRHMELAKLSPLGDQQQRHQLAAEMEKHGMMAEATTQWELILRVGVGGSDDWYVNDSEKELGDAKAGKDDLKAADHWDTFMRSVLRTSSAFIEPTAYLTMPQLIHRIRARGLIKAGKIDEALKEIKLAQAALPSDTNLPLELVPLLEEAGRKKEADELFVAVYTANRQVIDDFPGAALYLNNTAWLCGRSNRKLDEAFEFAQKAVQLAPEKAGYLDTLAEVHFRRGNKDEAIALMKKCIEMEPGNAFFKEQLKRFQE